MTKREYLHDQLLEGLELLKYFNDDDFVRHIEINDIAISQFTLPKFNEDGTFVGGPREFREEYSDFVQRHINEVTNPCVYVFELVSPDLETVSKTFKDFSLKQDKVNGAGKRVCSAIFATENGKIREANAPTILYVGKSEKPIDGRIVVHFGYYEKGVAGLQLVYWGKDIGLKINLHVFELIKKEMHPYLEALEKLLFIQLKPIIGKR
jgi:hypothetical protein